MSVSGELDQSTAPELRTVLADALGEAAAAAVLVDLSDCNFIDSTGLSLLVETKRRLSEDDGGSASAVPTRTCAGCSS